MNETTANPSYSHYFTAVFEVESGEAQTIGLKYSAPADHTGLYIMALLAFAQHSLEPEMKVTRSSYLSLTYPKEGVQYFPVGLALNEIGQPVIES